MKKIIVGLLLLSIVLPVFSKSSTTTIENITKRGFMTVGITATDQPPFYFENKNGTLKGIDIDIANEIANKLEVALKINRDATTFNDLIPLVQNRIIDLAVSKLSKTVSRSARVLYSTPYLVFRQGMLVNRVKLARISNNDLKTKSFIKSFNSSLGVIKNSSYERYAKVNFPDAEIIPYDTWELAVAAIKSNEIFAIYRDELEITKIIVEDPQTNLTLKSLVFSDQKDPIAIATHPEEVLFVQFINTVLDNIDINSNIEFLIKKYQE